MCFDIFSSHRTYVFVVVLVVVGEKNTIQKELFFIIMIRIKVIFIFFIHSYQAREKEKGEENTRRKKEFVFLGSETKKIQPIAEKKTQKQQQ